MSRPRITFVPFLIMLRGSSSAQRAASSLFKAIADGPRPD
jgi:hypothetical protein